MRYMKKQIIVIITTLFLLLSSLLMISCENRRPLVVGTSLTPQFAYREEKTDEIVGFDIEFAKMIADSLGRELQVEVLRFEEIFPSILEKKVDIALAAIFITEERKKMVNMSRSYYESFQVILVRKNDPTMTSVTNENDFKTMEKILASQLNTSSLSAAASITSNDIPVLGYKSFDQAVERLLLGNIDAVVLDRMTANRFVDRYSELAILKNIEFFKRYYGVAIHKNNKKLLENVNNAIGASISSGLYMDWVKKYMVDND